MVNEKKANQMMNAMFLMLVLAALILGFSQAVLAAQNEHSTVSDLTTAQNANSLRQNTSTAAPSSSSTNSSNALSSDPSNHSPNALSSDLSSAVSTPSLSHIRPAFEADLDKIDDVNPYVIKGVMVDGNKLIARGQIKAVIKTKPGDFYHRKDLEQDLRAIYNLGYFSPEDMHVEAMNTAAGMVIKIHVKENPLFKSITFSGNKIVSTERMRELFKDQLLKPQSRTQIAAALKTIKGWYKAQGYLLATINMQNDDPAGKLTVNIDEGIIKDIKIICPTEEQKNILQETLTLKSGEAYNENKLAQDLKTAFKTGKFDNLEREVDRDKSGGYIISITSIAREKAQKAAATPILKHGHNKSGLPVLNKLIHSPMYKSFP